MPPTISERVTSLEARMDNVEGQVQSAGTELQTFRIEVAKEFERVHQEFGQFRQETREEFGNVRQEFANVRQERRDEFQKVYLEFAKVREEIRAGDEETRRFMRVLHEELVERIAALGGRPRSPTGRGRSRKN